MPKLYNFLFLGGVRVKLEQELIWLAGLAATTGMSGRWGRTVNWLVAAPGSVLKRRAKSEFELSENSDESSTPRVFLSSVANEVNCKLQSTQRNSLMRGRISLISRNPHRAPLSFGIGRPVEAVVRCAKLA